MYYNRFPYVAKKYLREIGLPKRFIAKKVPKQDPREKEP